MGITIFPDKETGYYDKISLLSCIGDIKCKKVVLRKALTTALNDAMHDSYEYNESKPSKYQKIYSNNTNVQTLYTRMYAVLSRGFVGYRKYNKLNKALETIGGILNGN